MLSTVYPCAVLLDLMHNYKGGFGSIPIMLFCVDVDKTRESEGRERVEEKREGEK